MRDDGVLDAMHHARSDSVAVGLLMHGCDGDSTKAGLCWTVEMEYCLNSVLSCGAGVSVVRGVESWRYARDNTSEVLRGLLGARVR